MIWEQFERIQAVCQRSQVFMNAIEGKREREREREEREREREGGRRE